ncbi:MAG: acyloxyacyl hydrolase [Chlorobiaceae bacterium]|nr:acyloxyacyl hydrolase [Chlorobiaceae bacterium]
MPLELHAGEPSGTNGKPEGVHFDEFAVGTGYAWGHLKHSRASFEAVPVYARFGFDINSVLGMKGRKGTLQFALEPFFNPVTKPDSGVETGLNVFFRYKHPVSPSVKLVSEIGTGPMYLSNDTREQGSGGFNFLNQFGLGAQVAVSGTSAMTMGYRFRHLSNAGTSQPNMGINSNALVISYSLLH